MAFISYSRRLRRTPFTKGVEAEGVQGYTVYNRMLLPTFFESIEADYHHLKQHVQIWDVSCERQVEISGPDAGRLVQILTPRDLYKMHGDQCYYLPVVDAKGGMLNDPVAIKHHENRWWISIADSDLLFWVKGLAYGMKLDVEVFEPDVSPLAIQGPKADDLMSRIFGDVVRDIGFFRYKRLDFGGQDFVVARSGYSKQGGYEIYVEGFDNGMPLWNALFEAGVDLNVRAGCPNLIERVEGGLLSYGNDMTIENSPYECGLGRFCKNTAGVLHIGQDALKGVAAMGPAQQIRAISISGDAVGPCAEPWILKKDGKRVGQITSSAFSPDFQTNVSIGMVERAFWDAGTELMVELPDGPRQAVVEEKFWI